MGSSAYCWAALGRTWSVAVPAPQSTFVDFRRQILSHRPVSSSRRSSSMPLKSKRETMPTTLPHRQPACDGSAHAPSAAALRSPSCWAALCRVRVSSPQPASSAPRSCLLPARDERQNAQQAVIALGNKDGADASVAHISAGLLYRRARRKRGGILVPDHVRDVSHHKPLWLSDEVNRSNPESIAAASVTGHETEGNSASVAVPVIRDFIMA